MGDGDLSARVGAALGCASVFRSADPREVRCLVEPPPGAVLDVHEWLVRELPRSERSADVGRAVDRPSAQGRQRGGLEAQLDAMLGLRKAVRSEDSPADGTVGPHSDDAAHVLDVLYDHIPRYTADQTPQTILHGLMTKHAASRKPSLALLRGVVETSDGTELAVFDYERQSLQDLLKFNLFLLDDESGQDATVSDMKRRFVVYELWELTSFLHDHGLCWNEALTPGQVWLSDGKWVRLGSVPQIVPSVRSTAQERPESPLLSVEQVTTSSPTERWCRGDMSNYEYLMLLNDAAGRRLLDSVFHPVFPWVSDFSSRQGGWRDLSKSKFRLNKGDNQLDRNYESSVIPHHITESLSEITFYIYMARRTPMTVLRRIVRSNFQPKEYPSTLERMFHWTPDECIPEFFSDASVFASVHGDSIMPDLVLPDWCENGHDFVRAHRSMLESEEVSSSLHKWIDLNFGVCLSGEDAVRNKNVPLRTKLGVGNVQKSPGFVQIFREAHPRHRRSNLCKGSDPVFTVQEGVVLSGPRHHNPETPTASLLDGGASLQSALQIAEDAMAESSFPPTIDYPQHGQLQGMLLSPAQPEKKSLSSSFVKLKNKHKARPKLQPGSDTSLVSPPAARETAQSRSPTVARFAHAIPKFFGADSPSHHSGVSPDHTSLITATAVDNTMSQAHSASYCGPGNDFGRPASHSRTPSGSLPTHSLPPTILNSSIGAHASPGTHIFRDLWHQLSKPDDEESNETTEDGNSLSDSEWAGLDFDTLDDTSLSLLRACPTIALKDASSHLDHQHRDASGIAHSIDSVYKLPDGWNAMTTREDDLHHSDTSLSADLFSIGCIMAEIYTTQPLFSSTSVANYCNSYSRECRSASKPSWLAKCIVEEQLRAVPIDIKNVILDLVHPHPRHRISAWRARRLHSSDGPPDLTPYDMYLPYSSPIFPPGFGVVYKYSAQLHGAKHWWDRLAITRKYLPAIIRLPDDAFHVALPSLLSFFKSKGYTDGVNTAQVCSATVFLLDSLVNRIGRAATRRELLDVLLRVYESSDLPPVLKLSLVTPEVLKTITTAFGPVKMLRHFFPAILDWLSAPPAYRSKEGVDVHDGRKTRPSPLFSSESANMLAVSVGELASSDYLGSALAVKYMLPALLPLMGKIHPKWMRLTHERSLVREDSRPSSGTFERRSAYGGKNGDGIHVAYAPKQVLYENHYVAEAILLVCRELPPSIVCESLLPHLCDIVPRLVDVAENVSSARVDGVPDDLAREVYVTFRVLRNVVRSISEHAVLCDFLQKRASMLIDLINRIQPPFLHPRTVDAVLSTIKRPSRINSSERPVLVRHNSAPVAAPSRRSSQIVDQLLRFQNEEAQDLRAFTAVGVARTVIGALQRVGADAAIGSTGILHSIDAFLMRCAAIYSELEVSDFQWRMASEVVSEFCSPLRGLLGSEAFGKFFPSVQGSSVLQMLLLPNAQAQADQDRPRSKNAKQYLRLTTVATDQVVGDEDVAPDHAEVATLASHVPDLLQSCYRSARLNGIKTASFLHVSLRSGSAWSHDMNEAIFLVQEERKKRRLASTSNKAGGDSAWLRPRVKSYFFSRQEDPTRPTTMSGSSDQLGEIGRSWSMRGEVRHTIRAHSSCTRAIHVDQDEDLVVSASKNGSCRVWRLASYPSQATGTVHFDSTNVLSARSLEDGKRAVAMSSTSVHVWDVRTSQIMFQIPFAEEGVTSWTPLCMLPFKHYQSFAQSNQKIQALETSVLQGNADFAVTTVRKLLLVDARAAPRIVADWRVDSRDTTYVCATALISTPSNAVGLIATGTTSGQIFLTDKRTGRCVSQWQALHDSRVVKIVQYAPSYILVVGSDREARVWKITDESHLRLRMVVTNVPEGVRETQIAVQAYADSVLLYVAASAKLYTTRLIHDASPEARRSDVPAVRLESWSLVDNMPGTGTGVSAVTTSVSDRSAGANSPERSRLHRTKMSAQSVAVLPLRQVVLVGGEDGSLRTCV